jgi:microcompartment protein CcmK/EutM
MANEEVLNFIKDQTAKGFNREEITRDLITQGGWTQEDVHSAYATLGDSIMGNTDTSQLSRSALPNPLSQEASNNLNQRSSNGSLPKLLSVFLIALVFVGGGALAYAGWNHFKPFSETAPEVSVAEEPNEPNELNEPDELGEVALMPREVQESTATVVDVQDAPAERSLSVESVTPSGVSLGRVENGVLLRWRFDKATADLEFEVQRAVGAGAFVDLAVVPAGALEYLDKTVSSGVLYSYRVRARSDTTMSAFSSVAAHQEKDVSVSPSEYAFVGIESEGVGVSVSGQTLVSRGMVAVSVFTEPSAPVDRPVIAPVARLVVPVANLDLDTGGPLQVMLPPHKDFAFGSDPVVWALVRVKGASGEVTEFSAVYSMNYAPVAVEMSMLRAVREREGLPAWVEIDVIPLLTR